MRIGAASGVVWILSVVPCLAGDLENGVKFHERKDYAKAVIALQKAVANDNAAAQRRLGFMYYHGEGVAQDNKRAVALFEKAAEAGDIESAFNLARMYEFGMAVEQDDKRAAAWYRKGAEMGDPGSQFGASVMYYKGQGVVRDRIEAAKWWTLAMLKGGEFAEDARRSVESAEAALTPEEIAEGKRRAAEWIEARKGKK
jgi:TPR repeat protein